MTTPLLAAGPVQASGEALPRRARLGVGLATLAIWALAAGSAAYWALRLVGSGAPAPAAAVAAPAAVAADPQALAQALGARAGAASAPAVAPAASRFALQGVVAWGGQGGAAVISVDGGPAKPYRVGQKVDEGVLLLAVTGRRASLGPSLAAPAAFSLEMPALSTAAPASAQVPARIPEGPGAGASAGAALLPPPAPANAVEPAVPVAPAATVPGQTAPVAESTLQSIGSAARNHAPVMGAP